MNQSPYLTATEAAQYLRLDTTFGKNKIIRYARAGRIKCMRVGKPYLFTKEQLDDFVLMESERKRP